MLALACANASVYPYGPAAPWAGPWGAGPWGPHAAWAGPAGHPAITTYSSYAPGAHWAGHAAIPAAIHVAAPHAAHWGGPHWAGPAHAHAVVPAHAATYTAKTRGAVHTAPLPGHVLSQTSLNLAAPAGTW
jgi:hypothetical protein